MWLNQILEQLRKFLIENPLGVIILSILSGLLVNVIPSFFPILNSIVNVRIWILFALAISGMLVTLFPVSLILSSRVRKYKNDKDMFEEKYNNEKQERDTIQEAYEIKSRITLIDEKLLNYISRIAKGHNNSDELDKLTTSILSIIANEIRPLKYDGFSIFCRDPQEPDYLISWKCYYTESQEFFRFYVGDRDDEHQGVAGKTFKDQQIRVVHLDRQEDGKLKSDSEFFVFFPGQKPRYKSFICVPIIGDEGNSLGVLSIDSVQRDAFDSQEIKELIILLSKRFASILIVAIGISSLK
jgi:transcriptional regulator with GAF, ATPase, and Fis domain